MSDNRKVAADLLLEAGTVVTKDRPGIHGSAENSFGMIAEMWSVHINHVIATRNTPLVEPGPVKLSAVDVAFMMADLKKARAMYGDVTNRDNFVDGIGYLSLAGMLALPDPDENKYATGLDRVMSTDQAAKPAKLKDTAMSDEDNLKEQISRAVGLK